MIYAISRSCGMALIFFFSANKMNVVELGFIEFYLLESANLRLWKVSEVMH